ncbi:hypothetical protein [Pseudomonas sp. VS38]|uniref:hypothetical protein n=1 Tax=Pseudomonas sp. VS38 TaxID=2834066 RepID=UPI001BDE668F|nr:hypothetical protein [Pseudomonas sp. VS38]MBT1266411.1 hypothetical protein [Pseudomonas sp. VS38]
MSDKQEIPAFPTGDHPESQLYANPGMSLRDYFAAKAMQALIANMPQGAVVPIMKDTPDNQVKGLNSIATVAWMVSDAMLAARSA